MAAQVVAASDLADIRWGLQWPAAEPGFQSWPSGLPEVDRLAA